MTLYTKVCMHYCTPLIQIEHFLSPVGPLNKLGKYEQTQFHSSSFDKNLNQVLVFKLSPCCCNERLSSGYFPGVWVLKADVSEHCVGSIFNRWWSVNDSHFITCWRWNRHSFPKRRLLILRRRGNTQKTNLNQVLQRACFIGIPATVPQSSYMSLAPIMMLLFGLTEGWTLCDS
jgi:hypothetical protein